MGSLKSKLVVVAVLVGATLVYSACGSVAEDNQAAVTVEAQAVSEATPAPQSTATPQPTTAPTQPVADLPTELIEPDSPVSPITPMDNNSTQTIPAGSDEAVNAAIADLSKQTGLSQDSITVVSVEPTDWSDSSLGCPEEGMMYAQVITPGYLIVLTADGQQYEYHTDQTGKSVIQCDKN